MPLLPRPTTTHTGREASIESFENEGRSQTPAAANHAGIAREHRDYARVRGCLGPRGRRGARAVCRGAPAQRAPLADGPAARPRLRSSSRTAAGPRMARRGCAAPRSALGRVTVYQKCDAELRGVHALAARGVRGTRMQGGVSAGPRRALPLWLREAAERTAAAAAARRRQRRRQRAARRRRRGRVWRPAALTPRCCAHRRAPAAGVRVAALADPPGVRRVRRLRAPSCTDTRARSPRARSTCRVRRGTT